MTSPVSTHHPFDVRVSTFSASPLDRLNTIRSDSSQVKAQLTHPQALHLIFSSTLNVLTTTTTTNHDEQQQVTTPSQLLFLSHNNIPTSPQQPILLLGQDENSIPCLAIRLQNNSHDQQALKTISKHHPTAQFSNLRSVSHLLSQQHSAIAAHARSLFEFHIRHAFCGLCGSPTVSDQGGERRNCIRNKEKVEPPSSAATINNHDTHVDNCKGVWFPRSDPVAIMLVLDKSGQRVLLGCPKHINAPFYSCLAGFMEHGEGVEDSVRREVFEESGIKVGRVRFFGSQPWPYPYSLMLGCIAQAESEHIVIDQKELNDVRWFTRQQVQQMIPPSGKTLRQTIQDGFMSVPPSTAIAGQMIKAFADQDPITSFESSLVSSML